MVRQNEGVVDHHLTLPIQSLAGEECWMMSRLEEGTFQSAWFAVSLSNDLRAEAPANVDSDTVNTDYDFGGSLGSHTRSIVEVLTSSVLLSELVLLESLASSVAEGSGDLGCMVRMQASLAILGQSLSNMEEYLTEFSSCLETIQVPSSLWRRDCSQNFERMKRLFCYQRIETKKGRERMGYLYSPGESFPFSISSSEARPDLEQVACSYGGDKESSAVALVVDRTTSKAMMILKLFLCHFGPSNLCDEALAQVAGLQGRSCIPFSI